MKLIMADKPIQNTYIENFNGKFTGESLNENLFKDLSHARKVISDWRLDYNVNRPHLSIGSPVVKTRSGINTDIAKEVLD